MEKQCSKCDEVKPISEFGKLRGKIGGMAKCKVCNRDRYKTYRDKNIDKEKQRAKDKMFYNPIYMSNYRNTEKYRKKQRDKYISNSDFRFGQIIKGHLQGVKNREDFKEIWDDVREVYDMYDIPYHIDHMVPKNWFLVRTPKYLINHLDNLQVIDADYNLSKQDRWSDPVPSEYLDKIRPYIKKKFEGLLKSL